MTTEPAANDYKRNDPRGFCGDPRRGAALGRGSYNADNPAEWTGKLYVSRVPLDSGGYDKNGTYYGWGGNPLYWVRDAEYEIDYVIRTYNRVFAVLETKVEYPKASFARDLTAKDLAYLRRVADADTAEAAVLTLVRTYLKTAAAG